VAHEQFPSTRDQVELLNALRFVTFDFLYGHPPDGNLLVFLMDNGLTREPYRGIPLQSAYCGAKHGVQGFLDSVRSQLIHQGSNVKLTMVQRPGVNTPQFDWVLWRWPRMWGLSSELGDATR